eukprot:9026938-Lingulodinium_polyedra.AAC.1
MDAWDELDDPIGGGREEGAPVRLEAGAGIENDPAMGGLPLQHHQRMLDLGNAHLAIAALQT